MTEEVVSVKSGWQVGKWATRHPGYVKDPQGSTLSNLRRSTLRTVSGNPKHEEHPEEILRVSTSCRENLGNPEHIGVNLSTGIP